MSHTPSRFDPRGLALPALVLALWWGATASGFADTRIVAPPAEVLTAATLSELYAHPMREIRDGDAGARYFIAL